MARGRFITFEGIDGSGKSTAIQAVAAQLQAAGHEVLVTAEETDSYLGEAVRASIDEGADPLATAYLFLADRARHATEIRAALEAGKHVLCDRYMHSTLAYQGVTLAGRMTDPMAFLRFLHTPIGLEPDMVLLLDIDPEVSVARLDRDKAPYEKVEFLAKVRKQYQLLAAGRPDMIHTIDAATSKEDVAAAAVKHVGRLIK